MKNNSLTKKLIKRYMLTVIGFIALVFIIFIIGAAVCSLKIWYPDDPDYIILKSIKTHKWLIGGFSVLYYMVYCHNILSCEVDTIYQRNT